MIIKANKKNIVLFKILYIYYLFYFQKYINKAQVLLDLSNKINTMMPIYILKLSLGIDYINVKTQKYNCSIFKMFEIVLASFHIEDKLEKVWFF